MSKVVKNFLKNKILLKSPTGIEGFDEITFGGVPKGRPSLVCGSAGCGKTLFAMQFIVNGAVKYNEPGIFVSFEEAPQELIQNVASLGFNLNELTSKKLLSLDYIHVEKNEIEETGEFNLDGLFIRLEYLIDSIGAKRIVLDTIEALFSGILNHAILRAEIRRLFRWLKEKGVTAIITGESGEKTLTRQGLEEYVSDCVILLDHRVEEQFSTRRIRIIKYRGSHHGTNEYPFLIGEDGISVLPITSLTLDHDVSKERISSGIKGLDEMLGGKGFYRGTTVLISGTAGTGKSSFSAHFADACCRRGEKCIYFAFEESKNQIIRNMKSIGINLGQWEEKGLLRFHVTRPSFYSLEMHLAVLHKLVNDFNPNCVVIDPISNFINISTQNESHALLTRVIDFLKSRKITALLTNLTDREQLEKTSIAVSSIVDTWILLRDIESGGERNRAVYILKSRGMAHSNQIREFIISSNGVQMVDVYIGKDGILTGSARKSQMSLDRRLQKYRGEEQNSLNLKISAMQKIADAKIEAIRAEYLAQIFEIKRLSKVSELQDDNRKAVYSDNAKTRSKN